jgi:hypothetical protein
MKGLLNYFALSKRLMLLAFLLPVLSITGFTQQKISGVITGGDNLALESATVTF